MRRDKKWSGKLELGYEELCFISWGGWYAETAMFEYWLRGEKCLGAAYSVKGREIFVSLGRSKVGPQFFHPVSFLVSRHQRRSDSSGYNLWTVVLYQWTQGESINRWPR